MIHPLFIFLLMLLPALADSLPSEQEAVKAIISSGRIKENLEKGFRNMLPMVAQRAAQLNLNAQQTQAYIAEYEKWFEEDLDIAELVDQSGAVYCEHFSPEELLELAAFYRTPLGKKCLEKLPLISKTQSVLAMSEGKKKNYILQARLKRFLAASTTTVEPQTPPKSEPQ